MLMRPFSLALMCKRTSRFYLTFGDEIMTSKRDGWSLPMVEKLGHMYVEWVP